MSDGTVRVDVTGLMDAYERVAKRWNRSRLAGAILCSLAVSGSLILGVMALRWDVQHQRDVRVLKFFLQETETRVMCWRALALRWSKTPANTGVVDGHEAWVRGCVQRELSRQEDGAFGIRDRAPRKLETVNHDEAVRSAYER